jgi:hypothetical protein
MNLYLGAILEDENTKFILRALDDKDWNSQEHTHGHPIFNQR